MFLAPTVFLEHMLQVEARLEAFYQDFPHLRQLGISYDHVSAPLKLMLLGLEKQQRDYAQRSQSYD